MGILIGFLLTFTALVIYFWRPHLLFIFWMVTWPLLCPIFCLVGGLYDAESTNNFLYTVSEYFAYAYVLIILLRIGKSSRTLFREKNLLRSLILLCFFFLFHGFITNFDAQSIYINIKASIYTLLPMFVMIMDERTRPRHKQLYSVVLLILVVEVVFVFLNHIGVRAYVAWYQMIIEFPEGANLATGTFLGSPRLADYTATLFCFLCVDFFSRREIPGWHFLVICTICGICLLAAGNRMPLAVAVIAFGLTVFLYGKQYKLLLIVLLIIGYGGLSWLGSYQGGDLTENDGINRVVNGLTSFTQSKKNKDDDNSTVRLSEKLIEDYFWKAPVFGNGRACLGQGAYPIADNVSDVSDFKADARLAFMLVEYGVIGLLLYFLVYSNIFKFFLRKTLSVDKKKTIIIFSFFAIMSITAGGLWDQNIFPYTYLYFFALMQKEKEESLTLNNK